jgi:winged helix DNA-binding protein
VGVREARRRVMVRNTPGDARSMSAAAKRVRDALAGTAMTTAELRELLGEKGGYMSAAYWIDLMRVPPSSTWERRKADIHALAEEWLPPQEVDPDAAVDSLVRSYLRGFGPAPARDIASWAGLPVKEVAASLGRLELRRFRSEDGGELFDLPRAPLPDPGTPAPVRFLPTWDANTLVHARRTGVLPEEYRPRLFDTKNPRSLSTFLVDGVIAGSWVYEDNHVKLDPFEKLDRATLRELGEEAERLAAFHA